MKITTIILAHFVERENNLKRIVTDLMAGTVKPDEIIIFIDNPEIKFEDSRVTIIRSTRSFLPDIRFALGTISGADYCFFIDDDLSVQKKTLENFVTWSCVQPDSVLGLEGSILGDTDTPYTNDVPVRKSSILKNVDIVIRTYFTPTTSLFAGLTLKLMYPDLPKKSLDDVFLCLGNQYLNKKLNYVIPVYGEDKLVELPDGRVGQSRSGEHYKNRNEVCRKLMDIYENNRS